MTDAEALALRGLAEGARDYYRAWMGPPGLPEREERLARARTGLFRGLHRWQRAVDDEQAGDAAVAAAEEERRLAQEVVAVAEEWAILHGTPATTALALAEAALAVAVEALRAHRRAAAEAGYA